MMIMSISQNKYKHTHIVGYRILVFYVNCRTLILISGLNEEYNMRVVVYIFSSRQTNAKIMVIFYMNAKGNIVTQLNNVMYS